jgi:hypothetical protein
MSDRSEQDAETGEEPFVRVGCYAGHRAESEPTAFTWDAARWR